MRGKILSIAVFVVLISCILYAVIFLDEKTNKGVITMIEVSGSSLLTEKDYMLFTKLNESSYYDELSLAVIKDRLEKHPYIKNAEVQLSGSDKVKAVLEEKNIYAVILSESDAYFITEKFEILPIFSNTKFVDLPVISNPASAEEISPLKLCRHEDIERAFKIIDAIKNTNEKISKKLSEINLRKGGDIILTFSGIKAPIIFGKSEEAKKIVYLEIIWETMMDGKSDINESEYIDLRFANEVYVGNSFKQGLDG